MNETLLGKPVPYPSRYDPSLLRRLDRSPARRELGFGKPLPFFGEDVWRCYELSWLAASGLPRVGVLRLRVPCDSPAMVESKSLKLYLNSLAQTVFESSAEVGASIEAEVGRIVQAPVVAAIESAPPASGSAFAAVCLDDMQVDIVDYEPNPALLRALDEEGADAVCTHLFRSLCPVTGQPDWASLFLSWRGGKLDRSGLLAYLVSFRNEAAFHEQVVERIFTEVRAATDARELTVDGRFLRRGGIDINPYRSTAPGPAPDIRLPRQ